MTAAPAARPCPLCGAPVASAEPRVPSYPFCSPAHKLADLGNWLSGTYRIPAESADLDLDSELDPTEAS